ncbi:MAG: hypothetical protein M1820_003948 [Bogoriella megaspora]|nr:MAG: hypothetical protein M1820_003948 [Bogoriella megaspora]
MAGQLNLTIGVELEFILVGQCNMWAEKIGQQIVYEALKDCRIPNISSRKISSRPLEILGPDQIDAFTDRYSKWNVVGDASAKPTSEERALLDDSWEFWGIEVKSRVFRYKEDWKGEIQAVLAKLNRHFSSPDSQYRILVNENCGLHVHVGNRREGFPLRTIKSLLQLTTAYERCFDALHSWTRITDLLDLTQCVPPSMYYVNEVRRRAQLHIGAEKGEDEVTAGLKNSPSPSAWLVLIEDARDLPGLLQLQGGEERHNAYSLLNLTESSPGGSSRASSKERMQPLPFETHDEYDLPYGASKRTIEYRQHHGTLNFREIEAWISIVAFVTQWAHYATDGERVTIFKPKRFLAEKSDILNLLDGLRYEDAYGNPEFVQSEALQFYRSRRRNPQPSGNVIESIFPKSPLHAMFAQVEKIRAFHTNWACVQAKISHKAKSGMYGDLLSHSLDATDVKMAISTTHREKYEEDWKTRLESRLEQMENIENFVLDPNSVSSDDEDESDDAGMDDAMSEDSYDDCGVGISLKNMEL